MMRHFAAVTCLTILSACAPFVQRQSSYVPDLARQIAFSQRLRLRTIVAGHDGLPRTGIPWDIVGAPDGSMWFTDVSVVTPRSPAVGRVDPASGAVREYRKGLSANAIPFAIVAASDGNMWFADSGNGAVGKVTPNGAISEYSTAAMSGFIAEGIVESSNALWVLESGAGSSANASKSAAALALLVRADFSGALKVYRVPRGLVLTRFTSLAGDASGNLWFVAYNAQQQVVLVERLANGSFKEIATGLGGGREPCCPNVAARTVYAGSGTVWFTTLYYGAANVQPNALGAIKSSGPQYYDLSDPSVDFIPYPSGITSDGKGIWVASSSFGEKEGILFHVDGRGRYSSFPPVPLNPAGLAFSRGTSRKLWFTAFTPSTGGAIAEVTNLP